MTPFDLKSGGDADPSSEFKNMNSGSEAEALFQVLLFTTKMRGVEPVAHQVVGNPADAIIGIAHKENVGPIVIGKKRTKSARTFLISAANNVAHGANFSVAIFDTSEQLHTRNTNGSAVMAPATGVTWEKSTLRFSESEECRRSTERAPPGSDEPVEAVRPVTAVLASRPKP